VAVKTKELAVAACAHTMRGAGGAFVVGVGGSGGGGVLKVGVRWRVAVAEEELAAAGCAHAVRGAGAFGIGVGGSGGRGLLGCAVLSHRAAQLEEDQQGPTRLFCVHGFHGTCPIVNMDFVVRA
jgi:hypothetical protein